MDKWVDYQIRVLDYNVICYNLWFSMRKDTIVTDNICSLLIFLDPDLCNQTLYSRYIDVTYHAELCNQYSIGVFKARMDFLKLIWPSPEKKSYGRVQIHCYRGITRTSQLDLSYHASYVALCKTGVSRKGPSTAQNRFRQSKEKA